MNCPRGVGLTAFGSILGAGTIVIPHKRFCCGKDGGVCAAADVPSNNAVMAKKPRSGRALTAPMMARALEGQAVPGPVKTRIVRAVNSLLSAKKKAEIKLHDVF